MRVAEFNMLGKIEKFGLEEGFVPVIPEHGWWKLRGPEGQTFFVNANGCITVKIYDEELVFTEA